ncbi:hypothetical protein PPYR_01863 [Photinus pyralis]|uniref:MADF domain-containing protein n=2 Tax=Photinus pyralis TaxID=7054 RepID=A0A5N4B5R9_PHOPY|nr:uncharacterized protein LOC116170641 isoform X1 [Photinus pyralis]KAB0804893.1 hypothetical protein PPYR_01863 [Photinus pyralis]
MEDGELIDQVRLFSHLYDKSNKLYKDSSAIKNAWETISHVLGSTGKRSKCSIPLITLYFIVEDCQRRWAVLRARFNAEQKKYTPSGAAGDTSSWVYFNAMSFLTEHVTQRRTKGNIPAATSSCAAEKQKLNPWESFSIMIEGESEEFEEDPHVNLLSPISSMSRTSTLTQQSAPSPTERPTKAKSQKKVDENVNKTIQQAMGTLDGYMTSKAHQPTMPTEEDRDMCFGKMVGLELKEIKDENKKKELKRQILQILYS